jgi:hypothetical protein
MISGTFHADAVRDDKESVVAGCATEERVVIQITEIRAIVTFV